MSHDVASELLARDFELIETHISFVFLTASEVYKIKRPVSLGFLDFSTLALRERACLAEVELNQRLTSNVYLGVVGIVRAPSGELGFVPHSMCAAEAVLEWAVHMRRLRDEDRADTLLSAGELGRPDIERLAAVIADFHRSARSDARTASFGMPAALAENVRENFQQIANTVGEYLTSEEHRSLVDYQTAFLEQQNDLVLRRAHDGFVRDGHGDLRLEHCYRRGASGYDVIDCIEFNERFRYADVCCDLAFLTMDLHHHDRSDLADLFVAAYAQRSGDYGVYALLDFYQSYRATVRAKVSSLLAHDMQVAAHTRERAHHEARRYYLLAIAAGRRSLAPPRILVTFGLIASGKSTAAAGLAERLGLAVLSADPTRKELLGVAADEPQRDDAFQGAYSEQVSEQVYEKMFERAAQIVRSGRSVVLDATFRSRRHRQRLCELASSWSCEVLFVECRCARPIALERLARRAQEAHVSDGRAEIYDAFAARFEPAGELDATQHVLVDTAQPRELALQQVLARVQ